MARPPTTHDFSTAAIVDKARKSLKADKDKPGRIADKVLEQYRDQLCNLPHAFAVWIRQGIYQWARAHFIDQGTGGKLADSVTRQGMLDLWTEADERRHVASLGDLGAYLPSRKAYVDITPDLTDDELDEIGDHKISSGEASVAQGKVCKALAALRRSKRLKH